MKPEEIYGKRKIIEQKQVPKIIADDVQPPVLDLSAGFPL
jgi:hypothetical protein